jgi:hypothetical protein
MQASPFRLTRRAAGGSTGTDLSVRGLILYSSEASAQKRLVPSAGASQCITSGRLVGEA